MAKFCAPKGAGAGPGGVSAGRAGGRGSWPDDPQSLGPDQGPSGPDHDKFRTERFCRLGARRGHEGQRLPRGAVCATYRVGAGAQRERRGDFHLQRGFAAHQTRIRLLVNEGAAVSDLWIAGISDYAAQIASLRPAPHIILDPDDPPPSAAAEYLKWFFLFTLTLVTAAVAFWFLSDKWW